MMRINETGIYEIGTLNTLTEITSWNFLEVTCDLAELALF